MNTQPLDDNSWEAKLSRQINQIADKVEEIHQTQKTLILAINNLNQRLREIESRFQDEIETKRLS